MHVVADPSPLVLEEEVLKRVAAAQSGNPWAPVLIVVPSRELSLHLERRMVERFGVVLGVQIVHHAALARQILRRAGLAEPRRLEDALLDTLTRQVVRRAPAGRLRDFFRDRPAALGALLRPLQDLREAGIAPEAVPRALGREHAELAGLYARWSEQLEGLLARGVADDSALAVLAEPHAPSFAARFGAVIHHGAYELIGAQDDLVRALDRGREVAFLLPSSSDSATARLDVDVAFVHAQGVSAELTHAVRGALAAVASGMPPHEVAVIVRSFGPYTAAMDALLDRDDLGWHTSYTQPLRRDPAVSDLLRAFAATGGDTTASYGAHAAALGEIVGQAFGDTPTPFAALVASLSDIETVLGDSQLVPRSEAAAWLSAQVAAMTVPPASATTSGIRILDAMQARGLTFRHVALVGMNAGIFPHVGREDPFLPDAARAKLVTATGRFLPLASHRDREEHLILGMVLRAARDRLAISWRRADESGRPVVPSLALRDIARLTGRGTTAHDVEAAAMALPSHPRARLSCWATTPGLLRGDEEALLTALGSELGISTAPAVLERLPALAAGIALVMATDAFAPGAGFYDGRVGPGFATAHLAATALERLGACPLQFFFRHVLRVRVEPDAATPFELDAASVGRRVHDVLRDVYRTLAEEDAFETLAVPARAARARQLLRASWTACATADDIELAARFPILDGIAERRWLATLDSFFDADLARLEDRGLVPVAFESQVEKPVPGGPAELIVKARYDRISVGAGGSVIGDYKTGGSLGARIAPSAMLSGEKLQVPLYALLEEAAVELLGVGPRHVPEPGAAPDPRFERFDGFKNEAQRAGVIETLHVLARLPLDGRFPLRAGQHCRYCDYADACRRHHPPTEHRESSASDTRDVRDCWDKQNGAPRIADVRAASVA